MSSFDRSWNENRSFAETGKSDFKLGMIDETIDLFRKCPRCGTEVPRTNLYPFLTGEDWAGYGGGKSKSFKWELYSMNR